MDFAIRNLSTLAYAQGFNLWHYRNRGGQIDGVSNGFFNPAADMMAAGDMILVSASDGGKVLFVTDAEEGSGVQTADLS